MKKLMVSLVMLVALLVSSCDLIGRIATPTPPPGGGVGQTLQGDEAVVRQDIFTLNTAELINTFNLPGNNAAQLWRITVETAPGQAERTLKVEEWGTMPEGTSVGVYRLPNDRVPRGETPDGVLTAGSQPKSMNVRSYEALYIRAINSQTSPRNVTVRITEEGGRRAATPTPPARTQQPAAPLVTSTSTATPNTPVPTSQVTESLVRDDRLGVNARETANLFNLQGNNTIQAWRLGVDLGPNQKQREVRWEITWEERPEGMTVDVYRLTNNQRAPGGNETPFISAKSTYISQGDALYIRVSSQSKPWRVTVKVIADGAWVLKSTNTKIRKTEDDAFAKHTVDGTGAAANFRIDWKSRTDNRSGTITSNHTNSPGTPLSRLVPGAKYEFNAQHALNTGGEGGNAWCGIGVWWGDDKGIVRRGPDPSSITGALPSAQNSAPNWSTVFKWTVPDHLADTMHVVFGHAGPGGNVDTTYMFEWEP